MQNMNRKGLSEIIQISLITLLSIAALAFVWSYVTDISTDLEKQLSPTVDCITMQSKIESACVDANGKVLVKLDVKEKINVAEFRINSESFYCGQNACSSCSISEEDKQTIYLEPAQASSQDRVVTSLNGCTPESFVINPCL